MLGEFGAGPFVLLPKSRTSDGGIPANHSTIQWASGGEKGRGRLLGSLGHCEAEHGKTLRDKLVNLFLSGRLTATLLCELSTGITAAGGCGVEDLSGGIAKKNAARKVGSRLGLDVIKRECLEYYMVPQRYKRGKQAKQQPMALLPFHEALSRSFARYPTEYLKHVDDPHCLANNFYSHESVVELGPKRCIPLRLFVDGASLDNQATIINILLASPRRQPPMKDYPI